MAAWGITIVLINPLAVEMDVTERISDVGGMLEEVEDDLLQLTHGDLSFTVEDQDGLVETFISGSEPNEEFSVKIEREDPASPPASQLLFSGVIDLPWSVRYNRKESTVDFQIFSVTKLLERISAETVTRNLTCTPMQASAGDYVIEIKNWNSCGSIHQTRAPSTGDTFKISNLSGTVTEDLTVSHVDYEGIFPYPNNIHVTTPLQNSYLVDDCKISWGDGWYRWRNPPKIADMLLSRAASFSGGDLSVSSILSSVPLLSPMSQANLPLTSLTSGIVETGDDLLTIYKTAGKTGYKTEQTANPRGGSALASENYWIGTGTTGKSSGDWHPYLLARPSSFPVAFGGDMVGVNAWDHTNGDYYQYQINDPAGPTPSIEWSKNGVLQGTVDTYAGSQGYTLARIEYEPTQHELWLGYTRGDGSSSAIRIIDLTTMVGSYISGAIGGHLRMMRELGVMLWMSAGQDEIRLYDPATKAITQTIDSSVLPDVPIGGIALYPWSFRVIDDHIAMVYAETGRARLRLWDLSWEVVADYDFGPALNWQWNAVPTLAGYNDSVMGKCLIAYNGNHVDPAYFLLSKKYAGVIPLTDFSGMSILSAFRELAILSLGFVSVEQATRAISIVPRDHTSATVETLGVPIELTELPLSEIYRESAAVSGVDSFGDDVTGVAGTNPARRLEIESSMIASESVALAIAHAYVGSLSAVRRELNGLWQDTGVVVRPLDVVAYDGSDWLVLSVSTDIKNRERRMRLLEVL